MCPYFYANWNSLSQDVHASEVLQHDEEGLLLPDSNSLRPLQENFFPKWVTAVFLSINPEA